jgi:type II secretory ATPase GspE/PulE/Tfp pilus assembly ATPase PilB-like protein
MRQVPPDLLTLPFLRSKLIVPVALSDSLLILAIADPLDIETRKAVAKATGCRIEVQAGTELVNYILARGIERGASDIHLEPYEKSLRVRYRIDGILEDVEAPPKRLQTAILSRVKIMARLNIAESRLPQDGRVKLRIGGQGIDFRVSTVPTLFGESAIIRILDQAAVPLDLGRLGFPEDTLARFRRMTAVPHGMILVTGPPRRLPPLPAQDSSSNSTTPKSTR